MTEPVQIGVAVAAGLLAIVILGQRFGFIPNRQNANGKEVVKLLREIAATLGDIHGDLNLGFQAMASRFDSVDRAIGTAIQQGHDLQVQHNNPHSPFATINLDKKLAAVEPQLASILKGIERLERGEKP